MDNDAEDEDFAFESVSLTLPSFGTAPIPKADEQESKQLKSEHANSKRGLDTTQSQVTKRHNDDDNLAVFYSDTKGDWEVLSFGKIYQAEVPFYKRAVSDAILGMEARRDEKFRIEGSTKESGAFELKQITKTHEFVSLTEQAAIFARSLDMHPQKIVPKAGNDFWELCSTGSQS